MTRDGCSLSRRTAFKIREQVERGRRLDRALESCIQGVEARERAFAHELSYGVTRLRGRLDHLLSPHVHRGVDTLDPNVREVLRLAAYQLLYMHSVPDYAAVSEAVAQVRALAGKGAAGLVNAVLRRLAAAGADTAEFPDLDSDPVGFFTTWGSHPRWLVDRWLKRWGTQKVFDLIEANNTRPLACLTPLHARAEEALKTLRMAGLDGDPVGYGTECLRLRRSSSPAAALVAFPEAVIQDPASHLVTWYANISPGMEVADLCAAPGGKALTIATGVRSTLAADCSESRMRMVQENAKRTGVEVNCVVADAHNPPIKSADAILLDVPCTGTGTLARHPDIRWRLSPDSVSKITRVQDRLLDSAAPLVRVGGLLIYSTCTLEPEENHSLVEGFLLRNPGFELEPSDTVDGEFLDESGYLCVHPDKDGRDGSFAARLRRMH